MADLHVGDAALARLDAVEEVAEVRPARKLGKLLGPQRLGGTWRYLESKAQNLGALRRRV